MAPLFPLPVKSSGVLADPRPPARQLRPGTVTARRHEPTAAGSIGSMPVPLTDLLKPSPAAAGDFDKVLRTGGELKSLFRAFRAFRALGAAVAPVMSVDEHP